MPHSIKTATTKDFRVYVKNGRTFAYLQEHYSCSEEDVRERIRQLFGNGAKEVERGLEVNGDREPKRIESHTATDDVTEEITETPQPDTKLAPHEMSLEGLRSYKQSLENELKNMDSRIADLTRDSRAHGRRASRIRSEIDSLRQRIQDLEHDRAKAIEDQQQVDALREELSTRHVEKQDELDVICQEIERRTTISICIYEDGEIEVIDNPGFVPCDDGYAELVLELIKREEFQHLRVVDIGTLARAERIYKNAPEGLTLQLAFASPELECAFMLLS